MFDTHILSWSGSFMLIILVATLLLLSLIDTVHSLGIHRIRHSETLSLVKWQRDYNTSGKCFEILIGILRHVYEIFFMFLITAANSLYIWIVDESLIWMIFYWLCLIKHYFWRYSLFTYTQRDNFELPTWQNVIGLCIWLVWFFHTKWVVMYAVNAWGSNSYCLLCDIM